MREAGTAKSLKSRKHVSEISYEENGPQPAAAHSIRLTEKSSRKTNSRLVNKLRSAKEEKNMESSRNAKRKAKRSAEKRVNDSNLKGLNFLFLSMKSFRAGSRPSNYHAI